jgi:mRNA interferase MazF
MAKGVRLNHPRRGEVYLVRLDPTLGAEIKKTRPAIILQNDIDNRHSLTTIVIPLTSKFEYPLYPADVLVQATEGGLATDSVALLNQIRAVDRIRLVRCLGRLQRRTMAEVDRALLIVTGVIRI